MSDILEGDHAPEVKFEDLVGEGKKFRDPDAVAKKIVHADRHIERLEAEMEELRTDLKARLTVEEMLSKLTPRQPESREMTDTPRHEPLEPDENKTKPINLQEEVKRLLETERSKERQQANLEKTRAGLKERFGGDYNNKLKEIADNLSISTEFLTDMAKTSPEGFLRLVDSVATPDKNRPGLPDNKFDPLKKANVTGVKNQSYYRELRKNDPQAYFSKKVQLEMYNERLKQGADFYS